MRFAVDAHAIGRHLTGNEAYVRSLLTGSEFSKSSILKVYGDLDEDKVVVVPNAAASEFRPIAREAATVTVRERFDIAAPFVLSVGDIQPRKNQIGLIRAFARMVRAY